MIYDPTSHNGMHSAEKQIWGRNELIIGQKSKWYKFSIFHDTFSKLTIRGSCDFLSFFGGIFSVWHCSVNEKLVLTISIFYVVHFV